MQISQLNLTYVPAEDRLLLRVGTSDRAELRFWLTRAATGQLTTLLEEAATPAVSSPTDRAVAQFRREAAVSAADFSTPYQQADAFPLGESPQLIAGVTLRRSDRQSNLVFTLTDKREVSIGVNEQLVATLDKLLCDLLGKIDWRLPVRTTDPDDTPPPLLN